MFRSLTSSGVSVLRQVGSVPKTKSAIVKMLWPASSSFFMKIPDALADDGLIQIGEGDICTLTDSGRDVLKRRTWVCEYCVDEFFGEKAQRKLSEAPCKTCGGTHIVCKACKKHMVVVGGEFPGYKMMVRECSSPGVRMMAMLKKGTRKKKADQEGGNIF